MPPCTVVQVGVADPAGQHLDHRLAGSGIGNVDRDHLDGGVFAAGDHALDLLRHLFSSSRTRRALRAAVVVPLRGTKSVFHSSFLRPPAGAPGDASTSLVAAPSGQAPDQRGGAGGEGQAAQQIGARAGCRSSPRPDRSGRAGRASGWPDSTVASRLTRPAPATTSAADAEQRRGVAPVDRVPRLVREAVSGLGRRRDGRGYPPARSPLARTAVIRRSLLARSGGAYRQVMNGSIPIGNSLAGAAREPGTGV